MNSDVFLAPDERLDIVNERLRLIQKKQGLTFGTDAFLLAAYIRSAKRAHAVELGAGTGIVSLLLAAKNKVSCMDAVEIQPSYASLIERNAALNHCQDRIRAVCRDLRELDVRELGGEVDLVFSNPPYMRTDSGKRNEQEEKYIARHEVCGTIFDFCAAAGRILKYGGKFVTVWRPDRLTELLYALRDANLEAKRMTFVYADAESEPCMVLTEAIKGGSPAVRITAPLLLYVPDTPKGGARQLTPQAQLIYDSCSFE